MAEARASPAGWRRLRWRLRGAGTWPTFVACMAIDMVLLIELPAWSYDANVVDAFVIAGAANLAVVAVIGPLSGVLLRRRRRDLPRLIARDYACTALLVLVTAGFLVAGLAHRPEVLGSQRSFQAQSDAMRRYVASRAPAEYRAHIDRADSVRLSSGLYRTCVPGNDPQQALCLFIDTSRSPPAVRLDPDRAPNVRYFERRPAAFASP